MHKLYLLCVASALLLFGCKKKDNDNTDVTFTNHVNKQIVLTVYGSFENYAAGTNPVLRKIVNPQDKVILPGSTFTTGKTYFMDWYSDDYYYSNWYNDSYPQAGTKVAISPRPGDNTYYFDDHYAGLARAVFLSTDDKVSNWHAVDAYLYSTSTGYVSQWPSLADYEKYRLMTVNKNFTAHYTYKQSVTNTTIDTLNFKVMATTNAFIQFMSASGANTGSLSMGMLPTGTPPDYASNSRDTVMAFFPNSDYYFMMVRD